MSLKKNVIANYIGHGWSAFMSLAFLPWYIKYMGEEAYGLVGIYALLLVWLDLLDMGMTPTLNREIARFTSGNGAVEGIRDLLRSIESIFVCIGVCLIITAYFLSDWLAQNWVNAKSLSLETIAHAFVIMGFIAALRFIENIYRSSIIGLQKLVIFNVLLCIATTMRGLGSVLVLAFVAPTIEVFFIWNGVVSIFTIVGFASVVYANLPKAKRRARFSWMALRGIRRFASGLLLINILVLAMSQIDRIILSSVLSLDAFGYFALAVMCASVTRIAVGPINEAFYPRFSALIAAEQVNHFIHTFHRGAQILSCMLGALAVTIIFFAKPILQIWTQDEELTANTYVLLSLYVLGNFLNGLFAIPYQAQLALGKTQFIIVANIIALCIMVPLLLWLAPKYGAKAAGAIWVGINIGYLLVAMPFIFKKALYGQQFNWFFKDILAPVGCIVAITAVFFNLMNEHWHFILQLVLIGISGICSILCALYVSSELRPMLLQKVSLFLKRITP